MEGNKDIKKVGIYNAVNNLYTQFYIYYKQFNNVEREYCGRYIADKLNELIECNTLMYFSSDKLFFDDMMLKIRYIEFHLRLMQKMKIINKKKSQILSMMITDAIKKIKEQKK